MAILSVIQIVLTTLSRITF